MRYSLLIEKVLDNSLPQGYYYAHVPALDLTTHGLGIEGAKEAATDLIRLWIAEKQENHELIPREDESYFASIEIADALFGS